MAKKQIQAFIALVVTAAFLAVPALGSPGSTGLPFAWGSNGGGQLGNGDPLQYTTPVQVPGAEDYTAVYAGVSFSLGLKSDGTVWAWGNNASGRLGDGTTVNRRSPVQVATVAGITAVSAGYDFALARKNDGTVWAWGANDQGQLGDGTNVERHTPVQALVLTGITRVAAGDSHSLALKDDGSVWGFGQNFVGELGLGTYGTAEWTPVQIPSLSEAVGIAAGNAFSLVRLNGGSARAFGLNYYGQLGDGTTDTRDTPVPIAGLAQVAGLAAGWNHSLAVMTDGTLRAMGNDGLGACGLGRLIEQDSPFQVSGLSDVVALDGGDNFSAFLKADGTVWMAGSNDYGQLGDGTGYGRGTAAAVAGLSLASAVACGNSHVVVLRSDGSLRAWGYNHAGQVGDGSADASRPLPVAVNIGGPAIAVAAGAYHSLALRDDGTVWAWGNNDQGRLGDGTTTERRTPVQVLGITNATAVSAGWDFSCALLADGSVLAWGSNINGQLGDGTHTDHPTPAPVLLLNDVVRLASGFGFSLALRPDGSVWGWGVNGNYQLGDSDWNSITTPQQVPGLAGITEMACGGYTTYALQGDGSLWALGYNGHGELGIGNADYILGAQRVAGLSGVTAVGAGRDHALAVASCALTCTVSVPPASMTGESVAFAASASTVGCAGTASYLWDFGDGSPTSTDQNPSHAYAAGGTYTWTLNVTAGAETAVRSGTLEVCGPHCTAYPGVASGAAPLTVHFYNESHMAGVCGYPITFNWDFGDGSPHSAAQTPDHTYTSGGTFTWTLTASGGGFLCSTSGTMTVCTLSCTASASPAFGMAPLHVTFSVAGTVDGGCDLILTPSSMDFGDGSPPAQWVLEHTYTRAGTYTWTFTFNAGGATCTHSGTVTVCDLSCSATVPATATAGLAAAFAGSVSWTEGCTPAITYDWTFGDGTAHATTAAATHTYAAGGPYTWTFTASAGGLTCTKTGTITAISPPVIALMKKVTPPFKIVVTGSNLQNGIKVYINENEWTGVVWKKLTKIQLTGAIKAAVPKGSVKTFRFVNPDGGEASMTWNW